MIRIAITPEAFDAITLTMPLGSVSFEREPDENGQRLIWLEPAVLNRLRLLQGQDESYSDVILRLAKGDRRGPE